ncbi:hypothetical protein GGR00_004987 [Aminobacter aganoensis]|uniref:Uncharacterized protein n=1 Tax=Aminobacter aganoensis TaxID=83264 RepID=A0A7X0FCE3_9HYPH|nr:hypothetical protein [Aminobacter aganoensis]
MPPIPLWKPAAIALRQVLAGDRETVRRLGCDYLVELRAMPCNLLGMHFGYSSDTSQAVREADK